MNVTTNSISQLQLVELYPPGGTAGIALGVPLPQDEGGVRTGIILNADDIDAARAELQAAGVDVDAEVARPGAPARIALGGAELTGPEPPMFCLRDPDGNALLVAQGS